jgi:hypothetical protein
VPRISQQKATSLTSCEILICPLMLGPHFTSRFNKFQKPIPRAGFGNRLHWKCATKYCTFQSCCWPCTCVTDESDDSAPSFPPPQAATQTHLRKSMIKITLINILREFDKHPFNSFLQRSRYLSHFTGSSGGGHRRLEISTVGPWLVSGSSFPAQEIWLW